MINVSLRELWDTDLPLLLAWAHIKEIWTYLPTSRRDENLTWEDHFNWWESRKDRIDWMILVNTDAYGPRPVGVVHLVMGTSPPEVGLYIGEVTLWGREVGTAALWGVLSRVEKMGYKSVQAIIHPKNERSIRLFIGLGFRKVKEVRNGQGLYERSFGGPEVPVLEYSAGDRRSYQPSLA